MPRTKSVSDEEILKQFRATEDAFLTASEISDVLGLTRQAINYRLKSLEDEGVVEKKRAGSNAVGWWLIEDQPE